MSLRIEKFLGSPVATTIGTTAEQLFVTPAQQSGIARTGFQISNCDGSAGGIIYISTANDVAETNHWYTLEVGESKYVPWGTGIKPWIIASAASTNYRAQECIAREHIAK